MTAFYPKHDAEPEWDEARLRVQAYLQALHVTDQEQQERVMVAVLQQAAIKHEKNPQACPTVLAMNEIRGLSEQWFEKLLAPHERAAVTGFVSLFALDATKKWPAVFLADEIPADFHR